MPFRPFHVAVYQCKHQVMFERLCGFQHSTCIQATLRSTTFASSQALGTAPFQLSPQPTIPPPSPTHQCQEKNKSSRTRDESQQIAAQTPLSCLQYPVQIKSSARDFRARVDSVIIRGGGAGRDPAPHDPRFRLDVPRGPRAPHRPAQAGFRLRGVQPYAHAGQRLGNARSSNRMCQSCESTVPLVLGRITVGTAAHFSRIKLTCLATV